jgi:hypothetical protein
MVWLVGLLSGYYYLRLYRTAKAGRSVCCGSSEYKTFIVILTVSSYTPNTTTVNNNGEIAEAEPAVEGRGFPVDLLFR